MVDRFGLIPDQVKHLFAVADLRLGADQLGIRRIELGERGGRIHFVPKPRIDPMTIISMLQKQPKLYAMDGPDKLRLRLDLSDAGSRLRTARELLGQLGGRC
jgi:transcription-repair coupling factor (superfamily II helicase)